MVSLRSINVAVRDFAVFFFLSRRGNTISGCVWSSDVCSSDLCGGVCVRVCVRVCVCVCVCVCV